MIVGISGKARSGKDTFAEMLVVKLNEFKYPPLIMMAFANELKLKCQEAFDLTWEQLWGDDKEKLDTRYEKYHTSITGSVNTPQPIYWTGREIMQNFGAFYRTVDQQFWIKNLFKVAEEKEYTNVMITDVRYINEADYILDHGGFVIRIERTGKDDVHNMQHPSEIELDDYGRFSYTVLNNWTLEELKIAASECADFLK
jgi:hypothetical protein